MNREWRKLVATKITLAMHVPATGGKTFHQNRPAHGLVLNDSFANKDYIFSDGKVLHNEGDELVYLPKGSTYQVKIWEGGSCYALNFDADFSDEPFVMRLRDVESIRKAFHNATKRWEVFSDVREIVAMRSLYDIVIRMIAENDRGYHPSKNSEKLAPALEAIKERFADNSLTVAELASLCGMSEVYFRKLFEAQFNLSPKDYLIRMRMKYAKSLLASGQFTVSKIAELCGYAEPCHFSREFSKFFGVAPSRYQG